jgi:catechol 2,3-dioxygenase-like lactoylglutathione lyase family enzyme
MGLALDHTIVPAKDKDAAARFFARVFGLKYDGPGNHFAPVKVNDTLTLDFADDEGFDRHHLAFKTSRAEFDAIIDRLKSEKIPFGSGPRSEDMLIGRRSGGHSFYFRDPNGHSLQVLTAIELATATEQDWPD